MIVRLFTKDGTFVHEQVLPLVEQPDVIDWRGRLFVVPSVDGVVARHLHEADDDYTYEEASVYILDPGPGSGSATRPSTRAEH
jgi:hypothetical protein